MKRRQFLSLFGAAATAPFVPAPVMAKAASAAPFSQASVHAAIYHAQSRAVFSVWGLAKAANLSVEQATAVMEHLAGRGILGPLQGTTFGGRWASSKILQRHLVASAQAAKLRLALSNAKTKTLDIDLSRFLKHLRNLSDKHLTQQPSAQA